MNSNSASSKKYSVQYFLFLSLGILVSGYAVFVFYWMAHFPYTGLYTRSVNVITVDPGSPGDRAGLQTGDRIIRVGAHSVLNIGDFTVTFWLMKPGQSYKITYKRGSSELTAPLTPDQPKFPLATMVGILSALLYLVLGFIVFVKKSSDSSARILYLLMVSIFASSVVIFNFRAVMNPLSFISGISCSFIAPLFLHFILTFPEKKKIVVQNPSVLTLIYLPFLAWLSAEFYIFAREIQLYLKGENYFQFSHYIILSVKTWLVLFSIYMGTAFACLGHTFFTTPSMEIKKQLQWIFYGWTIWSFFVIIGFIILFQDLQFWLSGSRNLPFTLMLAFFFLPLGYIFAIFKYRLMDIDIVIHRSLAYFLVSGVTVLFYILLFTIFSWIFEFLVGKSTFATILVSALVVAFSFRPILIHIEEWIDQLFFREKHALHKAIEDVSQALITVRNPEKIFQKVFKTVKNALHIQTGALWLLNQAENQLIPVFSLPDSDNLSTFSFDLSHPLAHHFVKTCTGLSLYQAKAERQFKTEQNSFIYPFQKTSLEIFLPLIYKNKLLGIIGLGGKRSGDLYPSDDIRLLTTLAHQTAVAMENAGAYSQTEKLNENLEEKVKQIEQQQEEILLLQKHLLNENTYLREEIQQNFNFEEIIGASPPMKEVLAMVEKVAPTLSTVLIQGESGTGKELIARALHFNSPRKQAPFVKVNCAAIPANLLESELFGHEKGAFTNAIKLKTGKFELANKGTIFLDEIGDLEFDLQVKLLRVLQEKEFERVGGTDTINTDVRILAATNRDMENAVSNGLFREDLFYRLNVISITLPPLRDRKEDIRELTIHFLRKFNIQMGKSIQNIDPDAMENLKLYGWPGNVRELANVIERAVVLGEGDVLSANDLPQNLIPQSNPSLVSKKIGNLSQEIAQLERQRIVEALEMTDGIKAEAARILGLNRSTFNSKLRKYKML